MTHYGPNRVLASCSVSWTEANVLTVLCNDGFLAPIDLSAVATFQIGDVAFVPNAVTGDIITTRMYLTYSCQAVATWVGGPPAVSVTVQEMHAAIVAASAAAPNTSGRRWVRAGGRLTGALIAAGNANLIPARVPMVIELRAYGNFATGTPLAALDRLRAP